jgi:4-amino-4-deoxy-L-arabinose transferase-like glycosyltransferase
MEIVKGNIFNYLIALLCVLLILVKYASLSLAYFWDEAWPYATGVHLMYDQGTASLMPGAIPFDISRGHPLFFHFLAVLWMKIFGETLFVTHCFSLFISCGLLITVYLFGKKYFSVQTGFYSCLILSVQPVFLAQSAMLLPEILLSMFSLLTLYFYLSGKKTPFILTASCTLLIKESGVIIIATIFLWEILVFILQKQQVGLKTFLRKISLLMIPVFLSMIFFLIQKINTGYYFLPLYTSPENFDFSTILSKLNGYSAFLFIYQGRNALSLMLIVSLIFYFTTKQNVFKNKSKMEAICLLIIYITCFLLFSAFSFYSPRYLLCIMPAFILLVLHFYLEAFKNINWLLAAGLTVMTVTGLYFCIHKKAVNDHSMTYQDGIKVSENVISFCEENHLYERNIFANFLMRTYLTNKYCGYLKTVKPFSNVFYNYSDSIEYVIIESYEEEDIFQSLRKDPKLSLVKRFESGIAWSEIYQRNE